LYVYAYATTGIMFLPYLSWLLSCFPSVCPVPVVFLSLHQHTERISTKFAGGYQVRTLTMLLKPINRVTTCLEYLEMSGNLIAVREMSGILLKVREVSGKKSCQGKVA